jgi:hypothetical protein
MILSVYFDAWSFMADVLAVPYLKPHLESLLEIHPYHVICCEKIHLIIQPSNVSGSFYQEYDRICGRSLLVCLDNCIPPVFDCLDKKLVNQSLNDTRVHVNWWR